MITGPRGFLYNELKMEDSDDLLFLLGSPTDNNIQALDSYARETKGFIKNNKDKYIVFASTVYAEYPDDYYTTTKRMLELYLEENSDNYLILRIGNIVSKDPAKVKKMKKDRPQNDLSSVGFTDEYLDLEQFIQETKDAIKNKVQGVYNYKLKTLSLLELKRYAS